MPEREGVDSASFSFGCSWKRVTNAKMQHTCDVILGDRFNIPYALLRSRNDLGKRSSAKKVLINYFKGSHLLTLKAAMARLLQQSPVANHHMPRTFIITTVNNAPNTEKGSPNDDVEPQPQIQEIAVDRKHVRPSIAELRKIAVMHKKMKTQVHHNVETCELSQGDLSRSQEDESGLAALSAYMATHPESIWIVKASAGCKGKGIVVSNNFTVIKNIVQWKPETHEGQAGEEENQVNESAGYNKKRNKIEQRKTQIYVVQEYVQNPFLIDGRKCDIRVWVLLTSPYNIYIFNQGSCRTASKLYTVDPKHLSDPHIHLTNHDLQKDAEDFGKYEEGNEIWFKDLKNHVHRRWVALQKGKESQHSDQSTESCCQIDVFDRFVLPKIHRLIIECLLAAKEHIEVPAYEPLECFQLFGFDLMLDAQLECHLIEINGSPGCAERWLKPMVQGMIDTVIRPKFQQKVFWDSATYEKPEAKDDIGRWDLVWSPKHNKIDKRSGM